MNSPNVVVPSGEFASWQVLEKEMHSDRDTVNINFLCRKKLDITFVFAGWRKDRACQRHFWSSKGFRLCCQTTLFPETPKIFFCRLHIKVSILEYMFVAIANPLINCLWKTENIFINHPGWLVLLRFPALRAECMFISRAKYRLHAQHGCLLENPFGI